MRSFVPIAIVVAALAVVPLLVHSNVVLNFLVVALMIALAGQGWNILGGYGGQYSFGHAIFFGTGAYVTAILQVKFGVNAWLAFGTGIAAGAVVGVVVGWLAFRAGLRGSYFALVTLAFAEVLRILASVTPITGAGTPCAWTGAATDRNDNAAADTASIAFRMTSFVFILFSSTRVKGLWLTEQRAARPQSAQVESRLRSRFLFEHDLIGKPVSTFPDHALASRGWNPSPAHPL